MTKKNPVEKEKGGLVLVYMKKSTYQIELKQVGDKCFFAVKRLNTRIAGIWMPR